jgi:hypothetical protein
LASVVAFAFLGAISKLSFSDKGVREGIFFLGGIACESVTHIKRNSRRWSERDKEKKRSPTLRQNLRN